MVSKDSGIKLVGKLLAGNLINSDSGCKLSGEAQFKAASVSRRKTSWVQDTYSLVAFMGPVGGAMRREKELPIGRSRKGLME